MKTVYMMLFALLVTGCGGVVKECDDSDTVAILERLSVDLFTGVRDSEVMYKMYDVDVNMIETVSHSSEPEKYECAAQVKLSPRKGGKLESYIKSQEMGDIFDSIAGPDTVHYTSHSVSVDGNKTHMVSAGSEVWPNMNSSIISRFAANY